MENKSFKKKQKVLCICAHGNVRSVAMAYLIRVIYGHETLACGIDDLSKQTRNMLYSWADKIVFLDKVIKEKADFIQGEADYPCPVYLANVGRDVWHTPKHEELVHKCLKKLKDLDL